MSIPSAASPVWGKLLLGQMKVQLESLPIKIFLGSAKLQLTRDSSAAHVGKLSRELHDLFVKNEKLPSIQKDLLHLQ